MELSDQFKKYALPFFIFIAFFIYAPTLHFGFFIFDDFLHITQNPAVTAPSFWNFLSQWSESRSPLIFNVWQLTSVFWGTESAAPFRFLNIFFHGINVFLVFKLAQQLQFTPRLAIFGALLFLVFPFQVESVVWVSSLKGVLANTFLLIPLIIALNDHKKSRSTNTFTLLGLYIIGLLVKPSVIVLPILLVLLDFFVLKHSLSSTFKRYWAFLPIAIFVTLVFQDHVLSQDLMVLTFGQRLWVSFTSLIVSLRLLLIPFPLSFGYNHHPFVVLGSTPFPYLLLGAILLIFFAASISFLFREKRDQRLISYFLLGAALFSLLPTSGLIPFDFQNISSVADRYLYSASAFFALFIAQCFHKSNPSFVYGKAVLICAFTILTFHQSAQWKKNSTVLSHNLPHVSMPRPILIPYYYSLIKEGKSKVVNERLRGFDFTSDPEVFSLALYAALKADDLHSLINLAFSLSNHPQLMTFSDPLTLARIYRRLNLFHISEHFYNLKERGLTSSFALKELETEAKEPKDLSVIIGFHAVLLFLQERGNKSEFERLLEHLRKSDLPEDYKLFLDSLSLQEKP
jgi:protein O-mannosyl-transferase